MSGFVPVSYTHLNIVLALLDVTQHPLELQPPLDVLAGEALVRILSDNGHIFILSILP